MFPIIIYIFSFITFSSEEFSDKIVQTFLKGDAYQTNEMFKNSIELRIDAESINYQKTEAIQATEILKFFFRKYPVSGFSISQKGKNSLGSVFYICNYDSIYGHKFLVYIIAKTNSKHKLLIETLQIRNMKKGF